MSFRLFCLCLLVLALLPTFAARLYYTGAIGTLKVQVDLEFDRERDGTNRKGALNGHYAYDSIGNDLYLEGTLKSGALVLQEFYYSSVGSTITSGRFAGTLSADRRSFTGTWTSADNKRALPVKLQAVAEYRTITAKKGIIRQTGEYPVFFASGPAWKALGQQLYGRVKSEQQRFLRQMLDDLDGVAVDEENFPGGLGQAYTINIAYYSSTIVSFQIDVEEDSGAMHPSFDYNGVNYRINGDTPQLIGLRDLFDPNTPYVDAISDLMNAAFTKYEMENFEGVYGDYQKAAEAIPNYTLAPSGITFMHMPMSTGPTDLAKIPFPLLKDYLNPDGPLPGFADMRPIKLPVVRDPDTHLTDSEIAVMGRDAFAARYTEKLVQHQYEIVGGLPTYTVLLQAHNAWQAATLPLTRRNQYLQVRRVMMRLATAAGAMKGHILRDETLAADVEDLLGKVITAPTTPDPAARKRAIEALSRAEGWAKAALTPPANISDRERYANAVRDLLHAITDQEIAIQSWPDAVAELTATFAEKVTMPGMETK